MAESCLRTKCVFTENCILGLQNAEFEHFIEVLDKKQTKCKL